MTTTQKTNWQPTADVSKPGSGYTSAATATATNDSYTPIVPQETMPFNPAIVQCLRILARRGKAIREAREVAEANADLSFYSSKSLVEGAQDERGPA